MITDARTLADGSVLTADICIIGAGPAGIVVARELGRAGAEVLVLEQGGFAWEDATAALNQGETTGLPHGDVTYSRASGLGGTAHLWALDLGLAAGGARYRPLEPIDLEPRPWIPTSGWPLEQGELTPFYERAHEACGLGPFDYRPETWGIDGGALPSPPSLEPVVFQGGPASMFTSGPISELRGSPAIELHHHGKILRLETTASGAVTAAHGMTLNGTTFSARASVFVLACGGVENARLLLASGDAGRVSGNGLVGSHFMEHFHALTGVLVSPDLAASDAVAGLHAWSVVDGVPIRLKFKIADAVAEAEGLAGYCAWLVPTKIDDLPSDVRTVTEPLLSTPGGRAFRVEVMSEQVPDPASRVELHHDLAHPGAFARPRLHWQASPRDLHTLLAGQEIVATELQDLGLGRVVRLLEPEGIRRHLYGGHHHMGTTRMSTSPESGVVDPDCRVHDVDNLYVAGCSVFPTAGFANPTLTLVAMAFRLADHLRRLFTV